MRHLPPSRCLVRLACTLVASVGLTSSLGASSHMDAPLITLDDAANTTDVYAFVSDGADLSGVPGLPGGTGIPGPAAAGKYLTVALGVYPFEEPGIGPNAFDFDPNVLYEIHVARGGDLRRGAATLTYRFQFDTRYKNENTALQSYLGVVENVDDANQNRTQTYSVVRLNHRTGERTLLGRGVVPPNNEGNVTPLYNQGDNGENPAKEGVAIEAALDRYTGQTILPLAHNHFVFAGQRDDGFYADIQGVFDLLNFGGPNKPFDSQGGYNIHMIVLQIPLGRLGGNQQVVGVYATTSRRKVRILSTFGDPTYEQNFVQVARQGNPLFNEALVPIVDKDVYSRTSPTVDGNLFRKYAEEPELAALINLILGASAITTGRTDLAAIFTPDLIKVDLSTPPARLAGNPDDAGFHRLSIFGGDVLQSAIQDPFQNGGLIPGGWPNGRRFGDDVLDIAVIAILSDLRDPANLVICCGPTFDLDGVTHNDITYNKVMPYAATPLNGRNHEHHGG